MQVFKRLLPALFAGIAVISLTSWGFLVHKTVNQLAIYKLPKGMAGFFYDNMDDLVSNAPRPDTRRNKDSAEAPKHFIDLEMYGPDAAHTMPMDWTAAVQRYTFDTLFKYGYVPYQVLYMKEKLTNAFRQGNRDSILFYAADMGHYIGDANVPLHTTVNYDGQLTNQRGLHSLWESTTPELNMDNWNLYSKRKAGYLRHPEKAIWDAIRRGVAMVPALLETEKTVSKSFTDEQKYRVRSSRGREYKTYSPEFSKAYAEAVQVDVNRQLLRSAELVADFWYTSWVDAGRPDLTVLIKEQPGIIREKLSKEKEHYRNNTLIQNKRLLSRNTISKESE